jgi:anaerobic ribonucleoside-triphosphate reductase
VERVLLDSPYYKTAKAYIIYREQHAQIRRIATEAQVDLVEHYIRKLDWKIKENSNMCYSLQGLNNYISSDVTSEYWLNKIYPPEIRRAHADGDLHIHDLSLLSVYCVGWDLTDLLRNGFKGVEGKVESAPPRHLRSALGQIVNFFYTLQGEAAGAQALSNFDTLLAPFIRYDKLSYKKVKQALQEFVFNINIPTRVGFQTPFTNITMDLYVPGTLKDQPVVVGGKDKKATYGEFQAEMDTFNRAFAEVMIEGDAKGRVFTFPIPTYNITKDFDWDNPNLETVWQMTGKYGIPYFSNFVNSDMSPEDARSMCCRLRLDNRELLKRGGGLFGANPLTGSIGVVTINLPRIGHVANDEKEFFDHLQARVRPGHREPGHQAQGAGTVYRQEPLPLFQVLPAGHQEPVRRLLEKPLFHHRHRGHERSLPELSGNGHHHQPGPGVCRESNGYTAGHDHRDSGSHRGHLQSGSHPGRRHLIPSGHDRQATLSVHILCANEKDVSKGAVPYYTNSTQLPVNHTDDIFETLMLQDNLQTKYTGGTVLHLFLGEQVSDVETVKSLIRKVSDNYHLPYFTLTPTFSICPSHGYLNGEQTRCSHCDRETEVYSRVVGYLRPVKQWNDGKQAEYCRRKTFNVNLDEPGVAAAVAIKENAPCEPQADRPSEAMDPVCSDDALRQIGTV